MDFPIMGSWNMYPLLWRNWIFASLCIGTGEAVQSPGFSLVLLRIRRIESLTKPSSAQDRLTGPILLRLCQVISKTVHIEMEVLCQSQRRPGCQTKASSTVVELFMGAQWGQDRLTHLEQCHTGKQTDIRDPWICVTLLSKAPQNQEFCVCTSRVTGPNGPPYHNVLKV